MTPATCSLDDSLARIVRALRDGTVTAAALIEAGNARYGEYDQGFGAYIERNDGLALGQARAADAAFATGADLGPLQGIPISIKDLFGVTGFTTRAGSPRPLPAPWAVDGPVVAALRNRLGVFTGKTHSVEFAFGGLGTNPHWPVPVNPWDAGVHRVPGGSTAGGGVSLHVDALVALGTDTAGSARIPASMTGTVGFKTTRGRWPTGGIVPLSSSIDSVGILTRTVADARLAFQALDQALDQALGLEPAPASSASMPLAGCRLGLCEHLFWDDCSPGIADTVRLALQELEAAGAALTTVDVAELDEALELFLLGHLAAPELHEFLSSELPAWLDTMDPRVVARLGDAGRLPAREYLRRRRRLQALAATADLHFRSMDVLVTPTLAATPPAVASVADGDAYREINLRTLRNPAMANMLDLCAMTLPVGLDAEGMPVGLQLIARGGADPRLLEVGAACEAVLGTARERLGIAPRLQHLASPGNGGRGMPD